MEDLDLVEAHLVVGILVDVLTAAMLPSSFFMKPV